MGVKHVSISKSILLAIAIVLLLPLTAFALAFGEGVQDGNATVRGTKATSRVMSSQPSANHLNTVYVFKDYANMIEFGWCWWGPNWPKGGGFGYPAWFVHINDGSASNYEEYFTYGKIINGTFYRDQGSLPGQPTAGSSYPCKVENGGVNSKTWTASVYSNGQWWPKYSRNFGNLTFGYAVIGSERASLSDVNDAHFTSCQDIINLPSQPWTNWVAPWQGSNSQWSYDPNYIWSMVSATEHKVLR